MNWAEKISEKVSKKQIVALGTIYFLSGYKPTSIMELAIASCITLIACIAILTQWNLDGKTKPPKPD